MSSKTKTTGNSNSRSGASQASTGKSLQPSDLVVDELERLADEKFKLLLKDSLVTAKHRAKTSLRKALFKALEWPTNFNEYTDYLRAFARYIPQQSTDPAWTEPGTDEQQEVYDRLCHFYFLIDQKPEPGKGKENKGLVIVENIPWFSKWLIEYADAWGSFLDTTESMSPEIWHTFLNDSPMYRIQDSLVNGKPNMPSGWKTFNQFFARELNPGLRPIDSPGNNANIVAPADCHFRATYPIDAESNVMAPDTIRIKHTHSIGNINDLLDRSPYGDAFANGTYVHYFLSPYSYHRFHLPVSGKLMECRSVHGKVYLDVDIDETGQFDAPDTATDGYEFSQARGIVTVDTRGSKEGNLGIVGIIPIGMAQVSSVHMTAVPGSEMQKGDEFGFFAFGGSDIIMLFQEGVNPRLVTDANTYLHYGSFVAYGHLLD